MRVDFLLPDKKIIIENQGPAHYLKPANVKDQKFNLVTSYKIQILEKMGYKVILIPYNVTKTHGLSLDSYLIQQIRLLDDNQNTTQ